jgi:pSer/pThr/pTyr-binding forkhead associated (FHA) protein
LETELTIGREAAGGLELADPKVSRAHALVWREGDALCVRDLGSSNGTFVGGKRISGPVRLNASERIRVGDTVLRIVERVGGAQEPVPVERAAAPSKQPAAAHASGARRSGIPRWVWPACGALAAGGAVCVVAVAAVLILPPLVRNAGDDGAEPPEETVSGETYSFGDPVITTLTADGSFRSDENGVGAALSPGALDAGGTAQLRRSELGNALQEELAAGFELLTQAYSVAVEGELDAAGAAQLRFPAASQEARLAVILDDSFGGLLEIVPADGYLTVQTHAGALSGGALGPSDHPQSARRYFVVMPRGSNSSSDGSLALAAPRPAQGDQPTLRRCDLLGGRICVTDGVVYVYHTDPRADLAQAVAAVEAIMTRYAEMGLRAARIHAGNPVHIVVGAYRDPQYSSFSGNLYVNWGMMRGIASGEAKLRGDMAHELAHWIQDEEFVMFSAGTSGLDYWWIEVGAESLAFMVEPRAIEDNLFSYGRLQEEGDPRYALQLQPFAWSGSTNARYIHAVPVYVGMCEDPSICLFGQQEFVEAINEGANPFSQGGMEVTYYSLLEDVARYLLGHPPASANSAIPVPGRLRTGDLANEWILVRGKRRHVRLRDLPG